MGGRGGGSSAMRQATSAGGFDSGPSLSASGAVLEAVSILTSRGNQWVGLADLRSLMGAFTRQEQDDALLDLVKAKKIRLIPEENQKTIKDRDRAAAYRLSGEDKHLIGLA